MVPRNRALGVWSDGPSVVQASRSAVLSSRRSFRGLRKRFQHMTNHRAYVLWPSDSVAEVGLSVAHREPHTPQPVVDVSLTSRLALYVVLPLAVRRLCPLMRNAQGRAPLRTPLCEASAEPGTATTSAPVRDGKFE